MTREPGTQVDPTQEVEGGLAQSPTYPEVVIYR